MPLDSLVLLVLLGLVVGALAGVLLRKAQGGFIVNTLLGVMGALLGALVPVLLGSANTVDVTNYDFLLRGLMGAGGLIVIASLFRSARLGS